MTEFGTLIDVLESKVFTLQTRGANEMLEASIKGLPDLEQRAKSYFQEASEISKAINLLKSFRDNKQPLQVTIATPST